MGRNEIRVALTGIVWMFAETSGCIVSSDTFACDDDVNCSGGRCEANGYCSFPADDCPSGQRYGDLSGPFSGDCVSDSDVDPSDDNDDDDDDDDASTTEGSGSNVETTDSATIEPTTADDTAGDTADDETTGPPLEGLGCGPAPVCDKGEYVGSIRIESAAQIEEIAGYTSMTGWLEVLRSDLTCINFLACMETVGHDVTLFGNDYLTDVSGLDALTTVGVSTAELPATEKDGTIVIAENNALQDINGFNALQQAQISLNIAENPSLTSISGFQGFVGTQKDFTLRFNEQLTDVDANGLRDIKFIGGECTVTNNTNLCITDIVDMCETNVKQGPFGGNTANNNEGC